MINKSVYPYDMLFTIGSTEKEIINYIEKRCKYKLDDEEKRFINIAGKGGRTVRFKNNAMLIWVHTDYIPVIGHEIFHAVELLMEKINAKLTEETSEPYAYMIEYLWKEILPLIKNG